MSFKYGGNLKYVFKKKSGRIPVELAQIAKTKEIVMSIKK